MSDSLQNRKHIQRQNNLCRECAGASGQYESPPRPDADCLCHLYSAAFSLQHELHQVLPASLLIHLPNGGTQIRVWLTPNLKLLASIPPDSHSPVRPVWSLEGHALEPLGYHDGREDRCSLHSGIPVQSGHCCSKENSLPYTPGSYS